MKTLNNTQEAVQELAQQLKDPNYYARNYHLLNAINQYVEDSKANGSDATLEEEIEMYITDELNWEFPIEL